MYAVEFSRDAAKALLRMPAHVRALVRTKIEALAADPLGSHSNVTRLQGSAAFRLRVLDWRVIYRVEHQRVLLLVIKIGSRGDVYK